MADLIDLNERRVPRWRKMMRWPLDQLAAAVKFGRERDAVRAAQELEAATLRAFSEICVAETEDEIDAALAGLAREIGPEAEAMIHEFRRRKAGRKRDG